MLDNPGHCTMQADVDGCRCADAMAATLCNRFTCDDAAEMNFFSSFCGHAKPVNATYKPYWVLVQVRDECIKMILGQQ